jgi:phosphoserine phosphatase RsbU/P
MKEAGKLTGATAASIFIINEETSELQLKVATNLDETQSAKIKTPIGEGLVGYVAKTGKPVNIVNAQKDERFYKKIDKMTGVTTTSCLTVPIMIENKIVGAAQVLNKKNGGPFTEEDQLVLTEFSRLAGVTLDKSWLHEQIVEKNKIEADLELARSIQSKLLPDKKLIQNDLTFSGFYKPARNVGGDYFDYYPLFGNKIFFTVGDVSGKGAQASILMASVKSYLYASLKLKNDLVDVVYALNNFFFDNSLPDKFITMFLGIIDAATGKLFYINAGHEPAYIIKSSGKFEELSSNGFMLGALDNMVYETSEASLSPGDVLFVYTDGVTESKSKTEKYFGAKNLKKILSQCKNEPGSFFKIVPDKLKEFSAGAEQFDDITFLVVRKNN